MEGQEESMTECERWWSQAEAEATKAPHCGRLNRLVYHQFADHEGGRGLRTLAPIRVQLQSTLLLFISIYCNIIFIHKCCHLEQAGEVLVSVPGRVLMNTRSALRCP